MKLDGSKGSEEYFKRVYRDVYPLLLKVTVRITGSPEAAEDICQEAFIRFYERKDTLTDPDQARYWLIRVSKNLAFNNEKRKGRKHRAYERLSMQPGRDQKNEGERKLMASETVESVREALLDLPQKLRIVLVLKEYLGFNYKEIAIALKISEGNVKIRVFRARQQLMKSFERGDYYVP